MKRGWALLMVGLLLGLASLPAYGQESGTTIREVDLKDFPTVDLVISTGDVAAQPSEISLEENSSIVTDATVTPLGEEQAVDVVLVLDISGSMLGTPLASAIAAASEFVNGLPDQIRVAVLTFSDATDVAQSFTTDRDALLEVIGGVQAAGETALYDSVVRASNLFKLDAQRNIIVLSDGGDTASSATLKIAKAAAVKSGATVFTVGLETGEFDAKALQVLSRVNDGRYATADTADLSSLYAGLAAELKNQFLVSYESSAEPGDQLSLSVQGPNGTDSALVLAPRDSVAPSAPGEAPIPRAAPVSRPILSGTVGLVLVVALIFASVFLLLFTMGQSASDSMKDRELARRFGTGEEGDQGEAQSAWMPDSIIDASQRFAGRTRLGATLEERLERAGTPIKAGEFLASSLLAAVAGAVVGSLVFSNLLLAAASTVFAGLIPYLLISVKRARRQKNIQEQLADVLSVMASSLRAGHSFLQSLNMVALQVPEPGASEFARVIAEVRLGRSIDDALDALAERLGSPDFKWAVMAVNIQREAGGNLAEVFDTVSNTLRERDVLRRQVDALSAEGRMSMVILTLMPIGLALYLLLVNPDYLSLLWTTRPGLVMLAVGSGLLALGQIWMKRLVDIDV